MAATTLDMNSAAIDSKGNQEMLKEMLLACICGQARG